MSVACPNGNSWACLERVCDGAMTGITHECLIFGQHAPRYHFLRPLPFQQSLLDLLITDIHADRVVV